ncbi:type II secretion system F family protein [Micrococcus luteus]|uniref:type II secretion system F family protein n=1 Tax=Micrococcus TaxID=1269 RepID=UPI0019CF558F|nr:MULTISPECIES: type II secretion system F family protein [Micrococcus]MCT1812027.1 type II secretion system F family protein [Micrococcus luteus]MCV7508185.1 type II secretion system F family protein [Micrococcus luteus]MCV7570690.1 type II secretion system F family protein [Micrococcus luteus]MCV7680968.1 type II secretion system F family protein [Micrococcus luteus]MCV7709054.1 type II secretion system F family protein [Micrococcus luteus]
MSTTTAAGQARRSRAGRAAALLPWRAGRPTPEEETEVLVGVLRRWAALVSAGLTEEQAWRETACTLPACGPGPSEAGTACCAHHRARRRAEALAWDVPASHAPTGEAARGGGTLPWRTPARDPGWALVDAALAAGARAGAAPAAVARRLAHSLEADVDAARARRSAAAGPGATSRLLQWLPLGGLGLAWLLGTSPWDLARSPFGAVVAAVGLLFWLAGRSWTRLLLRAAAREPAAVGAAVVLDVLAALLSAGRSLPAALDDLGRTLPGARGLRTTATLLLWGRDWDEAWAGLDTDPVWIETAARLRPLHRSGMAGARTLAETAAAVRQQTRRADERAAEELAVRLVMPLGLCLLPAFVCWGVVPVVMALLGAGPG